MIVGSWAIDASAILPQVFQHLSPIHARHVEIQEQK